MRRRVAFALAGGSVLVCFGTAVQQWWRLDQEPLKWDFAQFWQAAVQLSTGHNPYQSFLDSCPGTHWCQGGYIFPPLLAEVLQPLSHLSLVAAARVWMVLSYALLALAIALTWRTLRGLITPVAAAIVLAAALFFLPLYDSLYFLQVGVLLLLLLALVIAATMHDSPAGDLTAGAWLGLATVLRVSPAFLLPSQLRAVRTGRLRVHALGAVAAVAGAGILVVALQLLTPYTSTYLSVVLPRISGGTGIEDNVSLPGAVLRAAELLGRPEPSVFLVVLALSALFVGSAWLLWQRALLHPGSNPGIAYATGLAGLLAAMPIVSSITWPHHLVTELLALALLAPAVQHLLKHKHGGAVLALTLVSYPLLWVDRHVTDQVVLFFHFNAPAGWRVWPFLVITRTNLIGMICLWLACVVALWHVAESTQTEDDHPVAVVDGEQRV
jgi:hypothetical protein